MLSISELYLNKSYITKEEWQKLINDISKYNGYLKKWSLIIKINQNKISYYTKTSFKIPSTFHNNTSFFIKNINSLDIKDYYYKTPIFLPLESNIIDYYNHCHIKHIGELKYLSITFHKINEDKILSKTHIYIEKNNILYKSRVIFSIPSTVLSIDFKNNNTYLYQKTPKYFDISKIHHLLKTDKINSTLEINTFPYLDGTFYLNNSNIDFARHSLILGSSGSGKSKYISSIIKNIHDTYKTNYKIVMIDPHASIENDIGSLGKIIDFKTLEDSINLFASNSSDIIATTELTLDLFKTLINDQYNSKLERVLRHSIYLLIANKNFNFKTLKNLLVEPLYRNELLNKLKNYLPDSIIHFFLNDFNDLKTKSFGEAISPIISFIDEMEMIPVFNSEAISNTLKDTINNNFLTLFSLDKTILGDRVTKTISGFIMQQLLVLIETKQIKEHIIFIIDEVPVIENPILTKFLSEARKYNLSLILAAQYFNQITSSLKDSIFSNVINYYIFRISRTDASLLVNHLDIKIPNITDKTIEEQKEEKINILSNLNNRECILRISSNNILTPAFKAKTLDFTSLPPPKKTEKNIELKTSSNVQKENINFEISNINLKDILSRTSSSRMVVKQ